MAGLAHSKIQEALDEAQKRWLMGNNLWKNVNQADSLTKCDVAYGEQVSQNENTPYDALNWRKIFKKHEPLLSHFQGFCWDFWNWDFWD